MKPNRRRVSTLLLASATAVLFSPVRATAEEEKPTLTKKELKALIANAKTPDDHRKIAAYYHAEAERLAEKQREHEEDLAEYQRNSSHYPSKYPTMGDHCRQLAGYYTLAARKAQALADMHEEMAKEAEKSQPK